jgi:hypothetical protein
MPGAQSPRFEFLRLIFLHYSYRQANSQVTLGSKIPIATIKPTIRRHSGNSLVKAVNCFDCGVSVMIGEHPMLFNAMTALECMQY